MVLEHNPFMNRNQFLCNSTCPHFFPSLGLLLICMTDLENYPSSLFYASDFLKVSWQVRDDTGVSSWVSSNNCTSSPLLWGVGTLVIDRRITMQSGWFPRPPSERAGQPQGNEFNGPYPSLSPQEGRLGEGVAHGDKNIPNKGF